MDNFFNLGIVGQARTRVFGTMFENKTAVIYERAEMVDTSKT